MIIASSRFTASLPKNHRTRDFCQMCTKTLCETWLVTGVLVDKHGLCLFSWPSLHIGPTNRLRSSWCIQEPRTCVSVEHSGFGIVWIFSSVPGPINSGLEKGRTELMQNLRPPRFASLLFHGNDTMAKRPPRPHTWTLLELLLIRPMPLSCTRTRCSRLNRDTSRTWNPSDTRGFLLASPGSSLDCFASSGTTSADVRRFLNISSLSFEESGCGESGCAPASQTTGICSETLQKKRRVDASK